MLHHSDIAVES